MTKNREKEYTTMPMMNGHIKETGLMTTKMDKLNNYMQMVHISKDCYKMVLKMGMGITTYLISFHTRDILRIISIMGKDNTMI